jgi:hypothetical protein
MALHRRSESSMETSQVMTLADQVQLYLERGKLAGLGPINLGPDGMWWDTERVASIVLADVAHCVQREEEFGEAMSAERWAVLAHQLRLIQQTVERQLPRTVQ